MTRAVDLVVAGGDASAIDAALTAAGRGERVLVVLSPRDGRATTGRVRRALRSAGPPVRRLVAVMTGADIVCVDGIGEVEAVVVRHAASGRLVGITASAVIRADDTAAPP